jgi:hypothetical protein
MTIVLGHVGRPVTCSTDCLKDAAATAFLEFASAAACARLVASDLEVGEEKR